jgi:NADPH:quinone reductase-like Zn-dependent oxidoreductase
MGNELRVRVKASGVNFADILARMGLYPDAPKPPMVVGYEVSGSVDASGPDASPEWIGKDVFGLVRFGGYSDCVVIPQGQAFEKPASLSHEQEQVSKTPATPVLLEHWVADLVVAATQSSVRNVSLPCHLRWGGGCLASPASNSGG